MITCMPTLTSFSRRRYGRSTFGDVDSVFPVACHYQRISSTIVFLNHMSIKFTWGSQKWSVSFDIEVLSCRYTSAICHSKTSGFDVLADAL